MDSTRHLPLVTHQDMLKIVHVPSRARYPLEVKVVAYEVGRGIEPLVKAAASVEQVVKIDRP